VDLPNEGRVKKAILEKALTLSISFTGMIEAIMERKQGLERERQQNG
jgi:hypothetical protein